jgi:hypothetical protein
MEQVILNLASLTSIGKSAIMLPAYVKSPSKADNCPSLYNEIAPIIEYVLTQILSL